MFSWNFDNRFSFFILDSTGHKIPVSKWDQFEEDYYAPFSVLNELMENGFSDCTSDSHEIDISEILCLSAIDQQLLGLPSQYPYEIYIQSIGQLNQNSFKFSFDFYDFTPNGNRLISSRQGALINIEDRKYLLSKNQYLICEALEKFNQLSESERTYQNNLKCFSDIKALSIESASLLDSYLNSQNVYCPDKIKIDLDFSSGNLEIIPSINIENKKGFLDTFDLFPTTKSVYPVSTPNGTTRVVIDDKQKIELEKVKKNRQISDQKKIKEIVENPEKYFDDDIIDISVFYSERVKEIGVYKPKFYPFVCPYKSEWIPGIAIKDKVDGEKRIHFKTENELNEFEAKKNDSQKDGRETVEWKGSEIPCNDAERFIVIARKQYLNPKEPVKTKEGKSNGDVLIIWENAEFLEYIEGKSPSESIISRFIPIQNLNPDIKLKQHQEDGIAWLQTLFIENFGGCLLADDMGLGKTLQLLYFIEWHAQFIESSKPYLIVAPVALLENWKNEYQKFFIPQNIPITLLYGSFDLSKEFKESEVRKLQYKHIILTNYETLKTYQFNLCAVDYAIVVLDEAQKIKTPGTLITNVSKTLKSEFKLAMTGTPVENTLVDLWCIMDFSTPGLLGNAKDFSKLYQNPLSNPDTDVVKLGKEINARIGLFMKRRLKQDVLIDLPQKIIKVKQKQMPAKQFERYKVELDIAKDSVLTGNDRRNQVLKSLWAIRDISDHPYLIDSQIANFRTDELISSSAKLQILIEILDEVKLKEEKAIVFADRKETQRMLQSVIYDIWGIYPSIINGDTPSMKQHEDKSKLSRQQTIDRFQSESGFNVIVMSQLAAGVGLNVTKANHVIHYTRHWNPAKEQQATDRAYRIGQQKEVFVYYPMAVFPDEIKNEKGERPKSFDEILDHLLSLKTALATNTLFPTEQAEVRPDDLFSSALGFQTESNPSPISIIDADKLNPNLFEAFIAALFSKQGYHVLLTPNSHDKGADVIALSTNGNLLIQAKQSKTSIGISAIQEIYTAKNYYESKFQETFILFVITNNEFSHSALTIAETNKVNLRNRGFICELIDKYDVTIQDINQCESQRMNFS